MRSEKEIREKLENLLNGIEDPTTRPEWRADWQSKADMLEWVLS